MRYQIVVAVMDPTTREWVLWTVNLGKCSSPERAAKLAKLLIADRGYLAWFSLKIKNELGEQVYFEPGEYRPSILH